MSTCFRSIRAPRVQRALLVGALMTASGAFAGCGSTSDGNDDQETARSKSPEPLSQPDRRTITELNGLHETWFTYSERVLRAHDLDSREPALIRRRYLRALHRTLARIHKAVAAIDDRAVKSAFVRYQRVYPPQLAALELLETDERTKRRYKAGRVVNEANDAAARAGDRLAH